MDKVIKLAIMFAGFLIFSVDAVAIPEPYILDPLHTSVTWHINHLGFSSFSGKYFATGTMQYDESKPENSNVQVSVKIADGVTGIPELDKHIAGNAFFDGKKYPTATFVSKKVTMTGANTAIVSGVLTLHGISESVNLKVVFNKTGIDIINNKKTVGFSATTIINRSEFGVTTFLPDLGDEVILNIEVEANLVSKSNKH